MDEPQLRRVHEEREGMIDVLYDAYRNLNANERVARVAETLQAGATYLTGAYASNDWTNPANVAQVAGSQGLEFLADQLSVNAEHRQNKPLAYLAAGADALSYVTDMLMFAGNLGMMVAFNPAFQNILGLDIPVEGQEAFVALYQSGHTAPMMATYFALKSRDGLNKARYALDKARNM